MVKVCATLLSTGSCSEANCRFRHDAPSCDVCRRLFDSENSYRAHCRGQDHKKSAEGHIALFHCSVCDITIPGYSWSAHVYGSSHKKKAKSRGVPTAVQKEAVSGNQTGYKFCDICRLHIPSSSWGQHIRSQGHSRRSRFVEYHAMVESSEKDKEGVTVGASPGFDVIRVAAASSGVTKPVAVQNTIRNSQIQLVEVKLSLSKSSSRHSGFSVSTHDRIMIKFGQPVSIKVTVRQSYAGVCEDRIEMLFEDTRLKKRFLISRPLSAVVTAGPKEELAQLQPVAPYIPRRRTARAHVHTVVEGVVPEPLKIIPYIRKLPLAKIPVALHTTLSTGPKEDIIKRIQNTYVPKDLNSTTYSLAFRNLLWIEEFRMVQDMDMFDIHAATLTPRRPFYDLRVPGLAEKRPSVLVGDRVEVQEQGTSDSGRWYEGHVHHVSQDEVSLRFGASFKHKPGLTYHVRFKLNLCTLRRQHMALNVTTQLDHVTFPTQEHSLPATASGQIVFRDALIAANPAQARAVSTIAHLPPGSSPFIVFGPPGTGKTVTIVEAIRQVLARNPDARVLACAPSNSAADLIALRLVDLGKDNLFRFYAPSRYKNQAPDELLPFVHRTPDDQHFSVPAIEKMLKFRVTVTTCGSASISSGIGVPQGHYSHIFIDEAGQATEPEAMVAIRTMATSNTNIVLSGDPKQLGPIIRSSIAQEFKLGVSYLERLMSRDVYALGHPEAPVVKLTKNFRSHPAILKFPNDQFYAGELESCGDPTVINAYINSAILPAKKFPIIFHAISGKDDREASSPSYFNAHEVLQVKAYVETLKSNSKVKITDDEIGIIAPYHAQVSRIRKSLAKVAGEVKVGSVEEFQGQERRVIILSTVRSSRELLDYDLRHTLGFVANPRRFNVAVTRAKALLVIVGDPAVLSLDPLWRKFLNYIHLNKGWKGPPPTWDTSEAVNEAGGYDEQARQMALNDMNGFAERMGELTIASVSTAIEDDNADEFEAGADKPWREMDD